MKLEVGKKYRIKGSDKPWEVVAVDKRGTAWGLLDGVMAYQIFIEIIGEWIDKPDPGEGWRLLHSHEDVEEDDEFYSPANNVWLKSGASKHFGGKQGKFAYRRRIAPQYVPYTWDDREELRGRWFRRKVKDTYEHERLAWRFDLVDGYFYVDSTRSDELLNEWVWLDGSPCGKKVL
jgi:hypothetical protein